MDMNLSGLFRPETLTEPRSEVTRVTEDTPKRTSLLSVRSDVLFNRKATGPRIAAAQLAVAQYHDTSARGNDGFVFADPQTGILRLFQVPALVDAAGTGGQQPRSGGMLMAPLIANESQDSLTLSDFHDSREHASSGTLDLVLEEGGVGESAGGAAGRAVASFLSPFTGGGGRRAGRYGTPPSRDDSSKALLLALSPPRGGEGGVGGGSSRPPTLVGRSSLLRGVDGAGEEVCGLPQEAHVTVQLPFAAALFNTINYMLGITLMTLASCFATGGWAELAIFLFLAPLTLYSALLLARCMAATPDAMSYGDIGHACFGRAGRLLVSLMQFMELTLYIVMNIITFSGALHPLLASLFSPKAVMLVCTAIVAPACLLTDLRPLAKLSFVGVSALVFLMFTLLYYSFSGVPCQPGTCPAADPAHIFSVWSPAPTSLLRAHGLPPTVGVLIAAYSAHGVVPTIYRSMADPSKFSCMMCSTYVFALAVMGSAGALGYLVFGQSVKQQIISSFPVSAITVTAQAMISVAVFTKLPLLLYPICCALDELLHATAFYKRFVGAAPNLPVSPTSASAAAAGGSGSGSRVSSCRAALVSAAVRLLTLLVCLGFALVVPGVQFLAALLGGISASAVILTLPAACYLKLYWHRAGWSGRIAASFVGLLGVAIAIVSTIGTLAGQSAAA